MKTRYYEYSKPGSKEKYTQITEAEYLVAKETPNRWFISFGDCVLECEAEEHKDHYNQKNHSDYINRDANGKKPVKLSFTVLDHRKLSVQNTADIHIAVNLG